MGNDYSNGTTGDTLESLEAEREDLTKTVACVRQMTRDFNTLAERRKSRDVKRIAFHLQLKGPHMNLCVRKGILSPEGFQWYKESMARKKVLGEQMLEDAAAYGQALVRWAEDLEKREKQQQQLALSPAPSVPVVTGGNALMPDEFGGAAPPANRAVPAASGDLSNGEGVDLGAKNSPLPFGPAQLLAALRASYQLNLDHVGDSPQAWLNFMANENDTEFRWTYNNDHLKYSDSTLPGFGAQFNNQVFRGGEVNYIGVGIGFAMAGVPIREADDIAAVRKDIAILGRASGYHQMTDAEYNWMKFGYDYADQTMQGDRWWK